MQTPLWEIETVTGTEKMACVEMCGGVHTQRQRPMQISIEFCTYFIGICKGLGLGNFYVFTNFEDVNVTQFDQWK